jgi:hypothetical protein
MSQNLGNMEIKRIFLSIQSAGKNKYRLGISVKDSLNIFKCRGQSVEMHIPGLKTIKCRTTCGNPCGENGIWIKSKSDKPLRKKGYDLYDPDLSKWLREMPARKLSNSWSKKLEFSFSFNSGVIKLVFIDVHFIESLSCQKNEIIEPEKLP